MMINIIKFFLGFFLIPFCCIAESKVELEKAVQSQADLYREAYNNHDAAAVLKFWSDDGNYINPETGEEIQGKSALATYFKERLSQHPTLKYDSKTNSINFPSDSEAILSGTFTLKESGAPDKTSAFKAYFKKQNNEWLIEMVREIDIAAAPDQFHYLKELEWLIGEWIDQDEDVEIKSSNQWDSSKNLIIGKFTLATEGKQELEGMQIIAWDPVKKKIRSWIFDSDGAFGEANWIKKGSSWSVETSQTLGDGRMASSLNIFTPIDQNSFKWESTGREVGGVLLPDISPVVVKRVNNEK